MSEEIVNEYTILNGGVEIEVGFFDGLKERVKVLQLPFRKITEWVEKMGDEAALVELTCDKEKGWADNITIDSFETILKIGEALNRPTFDRWMSRMDSTAGRSADVAKKFEALTARMRAALPPGAPLPASPSQPESTQP